MKVLGIETSSGICSAALADGEKIKDEISLNEGLVHSEKLLTLVDKLLKRNRVSIGGLDGIAVSTGPGSFTGIRVGVSAARGLAQGLKAPLAGISSLDGLAYNALGTKKVDGGIICPVINALRGEVFTAVYRRVKGGIRRLTEYSLIEMDSLLNDLSNKKEEVYFFGDAVDLHIDLIKSSPGRYEIAGRKIRYASALSIIMAGMKKIPESKKGNYTEVLPLYIRKPEAEVKWREKNEKIKTGVTKG